MSVPSLLEVEGLSTLLEREGRGARVVDEVSFRLEPGKTLALVGESGSGKTLTALSILGLLPEPPARVTAGSVRLRGRELLGLSPRERARLRGRELAYVPQDPLTSLNPVLTVGLQVEEALAPDGPGGRRARRRSALALLQQVGIPAAEARIDAYPHELSGGMRQRVLIAAALAGRPSVLIADEPTTALDVTVQAQVLGLLRELQRSLGLSILLITHDLGVVAEMADEVAVMYAGRIVEAGPAVDLFDRPLHPYTRALLACSAWRPGGAPGIPGDAPDPFARPGGCPFHPRCPLVEPACSLREPPPALVEPGRTLQCPVALRGPTRGLQAPAEPSSCAPPEARK